MDREKTKQNKMFYLANMLRGVLPANEISYVCAEIAYLFSILGNRYLSSEEEFIDFINCIDCSYSLREDLVRDLRPRWNEISRMQTHTPKQHLCSYCWFREFEPKGARKQLNERAQQPQSMKVTQE